MKKCFLKVSFLFLILICSTSFVFASDMEFVGITKKVNDTYVVKYGTKVTFNGSGTLESTDVSKAQIVGNKINVVGTGNFSIKLNGREFKFFSWNVYLTNGKYWVYNDVSKKIKNNIVYAEAFFGAENTSNAEALKVTSVHFGDDR